MEVEDEKRGEEKAEVVKKQEVIAEGSDTGGSGGKRGEERKRKARDLETRTR